jgi:hypothetical protein
LDEPNPLIVGTRESRVLRICDHDGVGILRAHGFNGPVFGGVIDNDNVERFSFGVERIETFAKHVEALV